MDQQPQVVPQGYLPPQPYVTVPPAKSNVLTKMKDGCANSPGIALAIIVMLLVTVVYLFAKSKGWIGQSEEAYVPSRSRKKRPRRKGKSAPAAQQPSAALDEEIDDLIETIES